jgi:hypothetical protein
MNNYTENAKVSQSYKEKKLNVLRSVPLRLLCVIFFISLHI